jgi:hypothetical protein
MKKSVFYFPIWGNDYIKLFSDFALKCLFNNLNKLDKRMLKNSKIEIWTFKKDIPKLKALKNIKLLEKKIQINIENIDLIYESLDKTYLNKYQTLSILQKIFINSHSHKYEYLWFIYPDFIFSDQMIKNFYDLKKKYDAYFIPVPQLIEEKVEVAFKAKNFKANTKNITDLLFKYLHPIVKICDVDNSKTNTPSMFLASNKNSYALKYFHMHPIVIKSNSDNLEMNNKFYSSLDEGLVQSLDKKNIFITKDNYFGICISLLKEKEYQLPNEKFNLDLTLEWCKNHINTTHLEISKYTYFIKLNETGHVNTVLENKINKRLNPLRKELLKSYKKKNSGFGQSLNLDIYPVILNNEIYSIIRNNYFKKYFNNEANTLKKTIKKNIKFKEPMFDWLKKLYIKNL